ncbi:MAG: CehA/McbA family metallohydrolase [Caldilineaceae bacterium]|nr:CehA/McbA family metallohydrolase [Caldilineaceae bacterium]
MSHTYHEYFGNIHMHTTHSDGVGDFEELVQAAAGAGLHFVFVTDHNTLVRESEEGYRHGVLTLVGEEVHDPNLNPPGNHLLCLGVEQDVTHLGSHPQKLIDGVNSQGALPFLAHPIERFTDLIPTHYPWRNWEVQDFHGIELWNYMSDFRGMVHSKWQALVMGFFPHWFTIGPLPEMLAKWDELTAERPVVALGGVDVHAETYNIGPIRRCFLPYAHCARALNTHLLTEEPFAGPNGSVMAAKDDGAVRHDREQVLGSLRAGHCWLGYDLVEWTTGFRFQAEHDRASGVMGDTIGLPAAGKNTLFQVSAPADGEIRLLRNGQVVAQRQGQRLEHQTSQPGVYRVEVWKKRWGKPRGWIFSNPIYVRE